MHGPQVLSFFSLSIPVISRLYPSAHLIMEQVSLAVQTLVLNIRNNNGFFFMSS